MDARRLIPLVVLGALVAGCSSGPERTELPDGTSVVVDQRRLQRQLGEVLVRVASPVEMEVTSLTLSSDRSDPVTWTGSETVRAGYERDYDVTLPRGRCGPEPTFSVELTYRVDGEERVSRTTAPDRYGAATRLLDAGCVQETVEAVATIKVGTPEVDGDALRLPVTATPTGTGTVTLLGYGDTTLFRQTDDSARDVVLGDAPRRVDLVVEPARCDPHAVAEDKVGTLFAVEVEGTDLPAGAFYTLPLTTAQRSAFFGFVREACGLG